MQGFYNKPKAEKEAWLVKMIGQKPGFTPIILEPHPKTEYKHLPTFKYEIL